MKRGINNCEESAAHSVGDHLVGSSQLRLRAFPLDSFGVCGTF